MTEPLHCMRCGVECVPAAYQFVVNGMGWWLCRECRTQIRADFLTFFFELVEVDDPKAITIFNSIVTVMMNNQVDISQRNPQVQPDISGRKGNQNVPN